MVPYGPTVEHGKRKDGPIRHLYRWRWPLHRQSTERFAAALGANLSLAGRIGAEAVAEYVSVGLFGALRSHADGASEVQIEADNIAQLLDALARCYPGMAPQLERGVSVSIDGRIYTESLLERVGPENEVILLPRVAGG